MVPDPPLKFPPHFPPTTRWKKFFVGVRWLGPDLSFFADARTIQAARREDQMSAWKTGKTREMAEILGDTLYRRHGWKTKVFLPQDQAALVFHGPRYDFLDEGAVEEAVERIESRFDVKIPFTFWAGMESATLGEVLEGIARLSDA